MTERAKVFLSGNSQAVRLPKAFRFDVEEVEITREGEAVVLRPYVEPKRAWRGLIAAQARGLSDDFSIPDDEPSDAQERPGLESLFE